MHDVLHDMSTYEPVLARFTQLLGLVLVLASYGKNCKPEGPFIFFMILMRKWHEEEWFSSAT